MDELVIDSMRNDIHRLIKMLKRSQCCINHARKWIKNLKPEFKDNGTYRLVSEEIDSLLSEFDSVQVDDDHHV